MRASLGVVARAARGTYALQAVPLAQWLKQPLVDFLYWKDHVFAGRRAACDTRCAGWGVGCRVYKAYKEDP